MHSDSSDYSDWMADAGTCLQPPKRKSLRKVRRKRWAESSSDENEEDEDNLVVDDEEEIEKESSDTPGTSRPKRVIPKKKKAIVPKPRPNKTTRVCTCVK